MSEANSLLKTKKKKTKQKGKGLWDFFYNSKEGTILGRTCKSWFLIIIFYIIYYCCLAGFFVGMIAVFMYGFMKETEPWMTGESSILTFSAGVNAYPRLSIQSALIVISTKQNDSFYWKYKKSAEAFLARVASNNSVGGPYDLSVPCASNNDQPSDVSRFCRYDVGELGPCGDPGAEAAAHRLCVYVRVNKVFGWVPSIRTGTSMTSNILIDCEGQNSGDVVGLGQPIYYPSVKVGTRTYGRISTKYFPFTNQKGYVSPMIAVQFPEMKNNTAILIQCQMRNVTNSFKNVKFEIMVLDKKI